MLDLSWSIAVNNFSFSHYWTSSYRVIGVTTSKKINSSMIIFCLFCWFLWYDRNSLQLQHIPCFSIFWILRYLQLSWARFNVPPNTLIISETGFYGSNMTQPTVSKHWRNTVFTDLAFENLFSHHANCSCACLLHTYFSLVY